jgi:serine/threonine protein kinase
MEYIDGLTIDALIEKNGPLPNLVSLAILSQIFSGLSEAHEKGVCHRDIKPSNIMVDRHGCVKIMDFGIANLLRSKSMTVTGTFMGSPNFMSPEQVTGKKVTEKSDIFSAGLVLYLCATGQTAFANDNINVVFSSIEKAQPVQAFTLNSKLLPCISILIEKCIRKDPTERPDSIACLLMIDEFCRNDQFYIKKDRIAQLVQNGFDYKKQEDEELFGLYRNKARDSYRLGKKINSLREFAIAGCFGELDGSDLKIIKKVSSQRKLLKNALIACVYFCSITLICLSVFLLINHRSTPGKTHSTITSIQSQNIQILTDRIPELKAQNSKSTLVSSKKRKDNSLDVSWKNKNPSSGPVAPAIKSVQASTSGVPKPQTGFLKVKTNPPWTMIYVDGLYFGEYPEISIVPLAPGNHKIMIKKMGFRDALADIVLSPNDTVAKRIELIANPLSP